MQRPHETRRRPVPFKIHPLRGTWRLVVYRLRLITGVLFLLLALLPAANAQSVTGQISGTVVDSTGGALVGATVAVDRRPVANRNEPLPPAERGSFIFTGLVPGSYSLKVSQAGFKNYEQKAITVAAQERVDLHEIALAGRRRDQHGRGGGQRRARGHRQFRPFDRDRSPDRSTTPRPAAATRSTSS